MAAVSGKACPVAGCPRGARSGELMCKPHWLALPSELKRAVGRTWRKVQATRRGDDPDASLDAIAEYRAARDAAVDHANKAEGFVDA